MANLTISTKSKKLGNIPSINVPPKETCRKDAPCAGLCYARKGTFTYKNVAESHKQNYIAYHENQDLYFKKINDFLNDSISFFILLSF